MRAVYAIYAAVALVGAEFYTLIVLAENRQATADSSWIFAGIALGLTGIAFAGLRAPARPE